MIFEVKEIIIKSMFIRFNTTERAFLRNINLLSKQDTNAEDVSVLFAGKVYITQQSPICFIYIALQTALKKIIAFLFYFSLLRTITVPCAQLEVAPVCDILV